MSETLKSRPEAATTSRSKLVGFDSMDFTSLPVDEPLDIVVDAELAEGEKIPREALEARQKEYEHLVSQLKREVYDFTSSLVDTGVDINLEAVKRRLMNHRVTITPYQDHYGSEVHGITQSVSVNLLDNLSSAAAVHVIVHELMHAASGGVFTETTDSELGIRMPNEAVGGLSRGSRQKKFKWLNEAVTELLARQLMSKSARIKNNETLDWTYHDEDTGHVYSNERQLVEEITAVGSISSEVFVEAYFEEAELKAEPGSRMPKWHNLQNELKQAFGPQFLQNIEERMKFYQPMPDGLTDMIFEGIFAKDDNDRDLVERAREEWQNRAD